MKQIKTVSGIALLLLMGSFSAGCGWLGSASPTAAFQAFYEAAKRNDLPALKAGVTQSSLALGERMARAQNQSLDEFLRQYIPHSGAFDGDLPELRNEKIEGDNATLEVRSGGAGQWVAVPFVKENGQWKIAVDKYLTDGGGRNFPNLETKD